MLSLWSELPLPKISLNSPISVGQSAVGKERTIGIQACFDRYKDDLGWMGRQVPAASCQMTMLYS